MAKRAIPVKMRNKLASKPMWVDEEDFVMMSNFKWHEVKKGKWASYARSSSRLEGKQVLAHRMLLKADDKNQVDHIDGNGLNNQRSNLRECSATQNQYNLKLRKDNKTGFKGVFRLGEKKWAAAINKDGRRKHLGTFTDPVHAYEAYRKVASRLHGVFANL